MKNIALLINPVQEYAWGSKSFIPELLGKSVPAKRPQAELWMGAHPKAPSRILRQDESPSLLALIEEDPVGILGRSVAEKFSGTLPFLFKILAMEKPLSIQAHPDQNHVAVGFHRENSLKIPMNAPERNYRDENHKPELLCALTPFTALKGFRKVPEIFSLLGKIRADSIRRMAGALEKNPGIDGLKGFFAAIMTLDQSDRQRVIPEAVNACEKGGGIDPAFGWVLRLNREFPGDTGVLSPLLLNLVELAPGEAVFIHPGELHAYLEGAGVEVMANSDNVLRGGLTPKHVDIPELLKILSLEDTAPILRPESLASGEQVYPCPAEEFCLSLIDLPEKALYESPRDRSVEIMICMRGFGRIDDLESGDRLPLLKGASVIVPAGAPPYRITGPAAIYKVSVPA